MNKLLLDTTIFVAHLTGNVSLQRLLSADNRLFTPVNVLEEAFYKSLVLKTLENSGKISRHTTKDRYTKHPEEYEQIILFFEEFINCLIDAKYLTILDITYPMFKTSLKLSRKYHLLPNDALIAATCKHHGITRIATLDDDFKQVEFLEVIEP
jgi:hypothetical protein